ncbi:MAG: hypothetical protein JEZ07_02245 [Phycisphaerae bacterium]|nr:hypothetical protein [Phycisphaerae bacterium]
MAIIFVSAFVYKKTKKQLLDVDTTPGADLGFDLDNLKAMLDSGKITEQEYKILRDKMIK